MNQTVVATASTISLLLGILFPAAAIAAEEAVEIVRQEGGTPLGKQLLMLEDRSGSMQLEEVVNLEDSAFHKGESDSPNYGFTSTTLWAKIKLKNPEEVDKTVIVELGYALIDTFEMFVFSDGLWEKRSGGDRELFSKRDIAYRNTTYRLTMKAGQTYLVLFRFQTTSSMQIPVIVWHQNDFANSRLTEQIIYGLLYGLLLAMIIYHLFLFLPTRDGSYIYFSIYLAFIGTAICSFYGHSTQYILFWSPWAANRAVPIAMAGSVASAMLFTRSFLRGKDTLPRFDKYLIALAAIGAIVLIASFFANVQKVTRIGTILSLVSALSAAVGGVLAGRTGFRAARFFVLAWLSFTIGVTAYALKSLGLIESNFYTDLGLGIGTAVEALLFSLALGDRIAMLRDQRDTARSEQLSLTEDQLTRLEQMQGLATRLAEASEAMSAHMSQVTASTSEVFRAVSDAGNSIDIIGAQAQDVERTAKNIANSSAEVSNQWGRGQAAIEQTASIMVDIEKESLRISQMVGSLFDKIEEIDGVIVAVRSVAEQSKVLSVNASIEAAEAGDFGRGFGVIAQEINTLAQESESATRYVSEALSTIKKSLLEIVEAVKLANEQTSVGTEEVQKVQRFVRSLSSGTRTTAEQARDIARSVAEQSMGFSSIVGATNMINNMAEKNIETVDRMEQTVRSVDQAVENLTNLTEQA